MVNFMRLHHLSTRLSNRSAVIRYIIVPALLLLFCSTFVLWYDFVEDYAAEPEVWQILPEHELAPRLRPSELFSQPLAAGDELYSVPKYIHQSWMTDKIPGKMSRWCQTCRQQNRHWNWVLWTDDDNLKMVENYFPWFLSTYKALPAEINRADASRNMYMYLLGGVYADLDTECLQPFDGLFYIHGVDLTDSDRSGHSKQVGLNDGSSQVAFFGRMGFDGADWTLFHTIPNAWMASTPGHPFFLLVLEKLQAAVAAQEHNQYSITAEEITGPVALYHAIEHYNELLDKGESFDQHFAHNPSYSLFNRTSPPSLRMEILPPENIYPFPWNHAGRAFAGTCWVGSKQYNSFRCKQLVTTVQSYTITYWSHTWSEDLHKTHDEGRLNDINKATGF